MAIDLKPDTSCAPGSPMDDSREKDCDRTGDEPSPAGIDGCGRSQGVASTDPHKDESLAEMDASRKLESPEGGNCPRCSDRCPCLCCENASSCKCRTVN